MPIFYIVDNWPSLMIYTVLVVMFSISAEVGYRVGKFRYRAIGKSEAIPSSGVVGAVIALLAFLLAFTFGQAGSHYAARKQLVVQEANAIETAFLRADLLPEEPRQNCQVLLREYVDIRLKASGKNINVEYGKELVHRSAIIQDQLWSQVIALKENNTCSITAGLFIEALNKVFDLSTNRVNAAFHDRIPYGIRVTLVFIALAAILLRGYMDGFAGKLRSLFATTIMILTFSAVLVLIVDLDRPAYTDQRLLSISQQALIDLQRNIGQ